MGSNSEVKKVKKRSINSKLENLSIYAFFLVQITHIYEKYKFKPLFYISVFHNRLFLRNLYGAKLEGQKGQKEVN